MEEDNEVRGNEAGVGDTSAERFTRDEVYAQIWRLKQGWGYGRRTKEENHDLATAAADVAVAIQRQHPPTLEYQAVPKILHRVWIGDPVPQYEEWWDEAREINLGWELRTHDGSEWPDIVRTSRSLAQASDLIRLEVLYRDGGVYMDADFRHLRPLDLVAPPAHAWSVWEDEKRKIVLNGVIGAPPAHPAIAACRELARLRIPGATWWGGPGVTSAMLPGRRDAVLLPAENFYPIHYGRKDLQQALGEFDPEDYPEAVAIHVWNASWMKGAKRPKRLGEAAS